MKIETTHRFFEKRRFLLAYNLFVQLVSKEIQDEGLQGMRSFVTMDVIHTIVRILSKGNSKIYLLLRRSLGESGV